MLRGAIALGCAGFGGCEDISGLNGNPQMNPGQNCQQCHAPGGQAADRNWTIAGTVFGDPLAPVDAGLPGVEILIVDSATPPKEVTLISNGSGNFYTAESFSGGVHVALQRGGQRFQMQEAPPTGACNLCHALELDAKGSLLSAPAPPPYTGFDLGLPPPGRVFLPPPVDGGSP